MPTGAFVAVGRPTKYEDELGKHVTGILTPVWRFSLFTDLLLGAIVILGVVGYAAGVK